MDNTTETQYQNPSIKGSSKAVLVTGGAGYVGSHTCKLLAKNGYTPITVDRHYRENLKSYGPTHNFTLPQEVDRLDEIIKRYNITSCIHFAGSTSVPESVANPSLYYKNNFIVTVSLLDKLIECGVKTFVYSSSAATYGDPGFRKCRESDVANPISAYGGSKLMMEMLCRDYLTAYGLSSVGLRYFNAAGADPEGDVGELREKETHIVPLAIDAARQGKTFKIFGDKYDTPDGTCVRDYVHVEDIARAHVMALENAVPAGVYNLGTAAGHSNIEIVAEAQEVTGQEIPVEFGPAREGDPATLTADAGKFNQVSGWRPEYTLNNIVQHAWAWYNQ